VAGTSDGDDRLGFVQLPDLLSDLDDVPADLHEEAVFDAFVAWADSRGLSL